MDSLSKKLVFITAFTTFLVFVFPGVLRQGVIYCDNHLIVKNDTSCSQTEIASGNLDFYLRYLVVGILFLFVGMIVARRKILMKKSTPTIYLLIPVLLVMTLSYSWFVPPLVMYPRGQSLVYVTHVPSGEYVFRMGIASIIGSMFGFLFMRLIKKEGKTTA